jgi:hypothetical protein
MQFHKYGKLITARSQNIYKIRQIIELKYVIYNMKVVVNDESLL